MNKPFLLMLNLALTLCANAMEPNKPLIQEKGIAFDYWLTNCIHELIQDSSLKKATTDIRALTHTNAGLYKQLNRQYNTRILIKMIADKYAHGNSIAAALALKTYGAAYGLAGNFIELNTRLYSDPINRLKAERKLTYYPHTRSYLSLLPEDIFTLLTTQYTQQPLKTTYHFVKSMLKCGVIADDFRAISFLADSTEKSDLIGAAILLNTRLSRAWAKVLKKTDIERVHAQLWIGKKLFILDRKKALPFLTDVATQRLVLAPRPTAWILLARILWDDDRTLSIRYAVKAHEQTIDEGIKQLAAQFCQVHNIDLSEIPDTQEYNCKRHHQRDWEIVSNDEL